MMEVCIVHYNTPELTRAAVQSVRKSTGDVHVVIFDNSDRRPFGAMDGVEVIDNTHGQIIDFETWLAGFPDKAEIGKRLNNYGSAKHCRSVQWLVEYMHRPFILMDSDVLVKRDLRALWDEQQVFVGKVVRCKRSFQYVDLVQPFVCFLNVPMMLKHGVTYFRADRMYALTTKKPYIGYDTGAWFLEDCRLRQLPYKSIENKEYIEHLESASWKDRDPAAWLDAHKALYE